MLEQVVTSIASVADTAEERFVPYYDLFMPSLKHIVENAVQKELRLLRGKTIECISLIGLAVGKEKVSVRGTHILYTCTVFSGAASDSIDLHNTEQQRYFIKVVCNIISSLKQVSSK